MKAALARRLSIIVTILCLCAMAISGCSDLEDSPGRELPGESEAEPQDEFELSLAQGEYSADWEIIDGNCDPSMQQLMEEWPDWPLERMGITFSSGDGAGAPSVAIQPYLLRHFDMGAITITWLEDDFTPREETLFDYVYPSESELSECPTEGDEYGANFRNEMEARVIDDDEFIIEYNTTWRGYDGCDESELDLQNEWIPQQECTESYRVTLALEESCEPFEECQTLLTHRSRDSSQSDISSPLDLTNINCHCH